MAQTRLEKIGTIYSRLLGLYKSGALKYEDRPVWFDVYEAFPPKYEPRWDRHHLSYGTGGNLSKLGPPTNILYKEDLVRAKFFKVFGGEDQAFGPGDVKDQTRNIDQTYSLFGSGTDSIAQKFVDKYIEIENSIPVGVETSERNTFRETIEALELEGINLLNPMKPVIIDQQPVTTEEKGPKKEDRPKLKRPSLREIFERESEKSSEDNR